MASYTSRLILTLAIPSVFGFLSILFFKKRKYSSCASIKKEDKTLNIDLLSSMKLKSKESSSLGETACSEEMHLKENNSTELSSNCNQVSFSANLKQVQDQDKTVNSENKASKIANGFSHLKQVSCQMNEIDSAIKKTEVANGVPQSLKSQNGNIETTLEDQISSSENFFNHNGLKKQTKNSGLINGLSANNYAESNLNQKYKDFNGSSPSNVLHASSKSKSKKKGKSKFHENGNSCAAEPTTNGCKKDNTSPLNRDSINKLSNGVAALSINIEAHSSPEKSQCNSKSQAISINNCSSIQSENFQPVTTLDSQCNSSTVVNGNSDIPTNQSAVKNNFQNLNNTEIEAVKDCDSPVIGHPVSLTENHCATLESSVSLSEHVDNAHIDIHEPLTFSVDMVASSSQDSMIASPGTTYCDSLGSNDSGIHFGFEPQQSSMVFEFEIPSDHCGFLIGKKGNHVNYIKEKTNASIWIRNFPFAKEKKIVSVAGEEEEIQAALKLIRKRFPLKDYPEITLETSSLVTSEILCPPSLKLALPIGVEFQVVLSATVNAGHFFIQLPTHPSYHALPPFTMSMTSMYSHCHSPVITNLFIGNIVAAPVGDGWFRAEVVEIFPEEDTCKLKYLDYGGYQILPRAVLRQINIEFMQMPFQAIECYLADVSCHDELGWTEESKLAFENLAQGQILSAYVAAVTEDSVPCLYLYKVIGATNTFINQALVEAGYLKWITCSQ